MMNVSYPCFKQQNSDKTHLIIPAQFDAIKQASWICGEFQTWTITNSSIPYINYTTSIRSKQPVNEDLGTKRY